MIEFIKSPFLVLHVILSWFGLYRAIYGGHWERWHVSNPHAGYKHDIWLSVDVCSDHTGKPPAWDCGKHPIKCERRGRDVTPNTRLWCTSCNRNLSTAPGVFRSEEGMTGRYTFSCPCGEWSRWDFNPPAPIYLGTPEDQSNVRNDHRGSA